MKRSLKDTLNKKAPVSAGANDTEKLPDDARELADRYRGMNENELMETLLSETKKRKADGSYDPAAIKNGVDALLPLLDEKQKRRLREIIGMMDRQKPL